jgi:hypothetical protein
MADLWAGLCQGWGAPVHSGALAHIASTARTTRRGALWSAGDAMWASAPPTTSEKGYFSPIPSTTPITTDPYL